MYEERKGGKKGIRAGKKKIAKETRIVGGKRNGKNQ